MSGDDVAEFLLQGHAHGLAYSLEDELQEALTVLAEKLVDRNLDPARESAKGVAGAVAGAFEEVASDVWRRLVERVKAEGLYGGWRCGSPADAIVRDCARVSAEDRFVNDDDLLVNLTGLVEKLTAAGIDPATVPSRTVADQYAATFRDGWVQVWPAALERFAAGEE